MSTWGGQIFSFLRRNKMKKMFMYLLACAVAASFISVAPAEAVKEQKFVTIGTGGVLAFTIRSVALFAGLATKTERHMGFVVQLKVREVLFTT